MRTALDRLLARPSALRTLRVILEHPGFRGNWPWACTGCRRSCNGSELYRTAAGSVAEDHETLENCVPTQSTTPIRSIETPTPSNAPAEEANIGRRQRKTLPPIVRRVRASKSSEWDDLNRESAVGAQERGVVRLVDRPENRNNFGLWADLLIFRKRVYGDAGVREIWAGLRIRDIDLPTTGEHADTLWRAFFTQKSLLMEVIAYADDLRQRTGEWYRRAYEIAVGHLIGVNRGHLYDVHKLVSRICPPPPGAVKKLARVAVRSPHAMHDFRRIYLESKERNIYDTIISSLCDKGKYDTALSWHTFLVKHGDLPSNAISAYPMVRRVVACGCSPSVQKVAETVEVKTQADSHATKRNDSQFPNSPTDRFSRELMNRMLGKAHAVKPKALDDRFCARLFATKAFTIDIVISGLGMLGVEAIGPLALRELAVRAGTPAAIVQKIKQLKEAGISIGRSIFSRSIYKFASEDRGQLLNAMLSSDQHPDVFEDRSLQRTLLSSYVAAEDWQSVHRTLVILTAFHSDPAQESWNLLLRSHSQHSDLPRLAQVLDDMRMNQIPITAASLDSLHRHRLRLRRPARRPVALRRQSVDDLLLVANIWRSILESGGDLPPHRWRELLRRMGMTGRFEELRRLTLWLAAWYAPSDARNVRTKMVSSFPVAGNNAGLAFVPETTSRMPSCHPAHPLRQIFLPALQRAIVAWGFKTGLAGRDRHVSSVSILSCPIRMPEPLVSPSDGTEDATPLAAASAAQSTIATLAEPSKVSEQDSPIMRGPLRSLPLLLQLRREGVHIQTSLVSKALRQRLWILYGPAQSKLRINRRAKAMNEWTIEEIVLAAEEGWGYRLFGLPGDFVTRLKEAVVWDREARLGDGEADIVVEKRERVAVRAELLFRLFGARPLVKRPNGRVDPDLWRKVLARRHSG